MRKQNAVLDIAPPHDPIENRDGLTRLTFPQALRYVIAGHAITKLEWDDPNIQVLHDDGFLRIRHANGRTDALLVSTGDLIGGDWVLV